MSAVLLPCPGCGVQGATADDGHHICRRCEKGGPALRSRALSEARSLAAGLRREAEALRVEARQTLLEAAAQAQASGMTLEAIGRELGISKQAVSQLLNR